MRANEVVHQSKKKPYLKPELATHGSVQQLTEGGHCSHKDDNHDCGSNFRIPMPWEPK